MVLTTVLTNSRIHRASPRRRLRRYRLGPGISKLSSASARVITRAREIAAPSPYRSLFSQQSAFENRSSARRTSRFHRPSQHSGRMLPIATRIRVLIDGVGPDTSVQDRPTATWGITPGWLRRPAHLAAAAKLRRPTRTHITDRVGVSARRGPPGVARQQHGTGSAPVAWDRVGVRSASATG